MEKEVKQRKASCSIFLRNEKGEYLLQLRNIGKTDEGKWSLFGGKWEQGETPEETIVREVKEEIDFDLKKFKLIDEYTADWKEERFIFLGLIDKPIEKLTLMEGQDFGFFSFDELAKLNISDLVKKYIKKVNIEEII